MGAPISLKPGPAQAIGRAGLFPILILQVHSKTVIALADGEAFRLPNNRVVHPTDPRWVKRKWIRQ